MNQSRHVKDTDFFRLVGEDVSFRASIGMPSLERRVGGELNSRNGGTILAADHVRALIDETKRGVFLGVLSAKRARIQ